MSAQISTQTQELGDLAYLLDRLMELQPTLMPKLRQLRLRRHDTKKRQALSRPINPDGSPNTPIEIERRKFLEQEQRELEKLAEIGAPFQIGGRCLRHMWFAWLGGLHKPGAEPMPRASTWLAVSPKTRACRHELVEEARLLPQILEGFLFNQPALEPADGGDLATAQATYRTEAECVQDCLGAIDGLRARFVELQDALRLETGFHGEPIVAARRGRRKGESGEQRRRDLEAYALFVDNNFNSSESILEMYNGDGMLSKSDGRAVVENRVNKSRSVIRSMILRWDRDTPTFGRRLMAVKPKLEAIESIQEQILKNAAWIRGLRDASDEVMDMEFSKHAEEFK